jgi:glycosyltransferase involved in cell wall biosynthesis
VGALVTPSSATSPLRVLFILSALRKNGAVLSTLTTIAHLDRRRFQPQLFVVERGEAWGDVLRGAEVFYGAPSGGALRQAAQLPPALWRLARRSDVIVGGLEMAPTFLAVLAGQLTGRPSVGFVRNSLPEVLAALPPRYGALSKLFYPRLTRAVAISEGIRESVEKLYPALAGRTETVYIPLDLARAERYAAAAAPEGAPERPYLVAVGRLEPQKGFDVLLHAYARLRAAGVTHPLVIVGEGREAARLRALAASLGVADGVRFPGFQENPYAWIRGAEVFVSSSRFEGFCRVIAEAMAVGTPVVATDCPSGPAEVLEGGRAGALVKSEDPEALAKGIAELLGDPAARARFRERGLERVRAFSPERVVARFGEVLEGVAGLRG